MIRFAQFALKQTANLKTVTLYVRDVTHNQFIKCVLPANISIFTKCIQEETIILIVSMSSSTNRVHSDQWSLILPCLWRNSLDYLKKSLNFESC